MNQASATVKPKAKRKKRDGPGLQAQYETAKLKLTVIPRAQLLAELMGFQEMKGYQPSWVTANYVSLVDDWPPKIKPEPIEPSPPIIDWFMLKAKIFHITKSKNKKVAEQIKAWNEPW